MDRISRIIRYKWILVLLGILVVLLLAGCLASDPGKNPDAESGGSVSVVGRVVSGSGGPLAGMAVRLARAGLVDTTDALGRYRLEGEPVASGLTKGAATAGVAEEEDTLHFEQAGQSVLSLEVSWVDSLPDVSIVQRGVTASLTPGGSAFARAEIVLWGGGILEATPHIVQAFHNTLVGEISGFLYFPPSPPVREYSLFVRTVDLAGRITGRSQTLPFNSLAGNLNLPAFRIGNTLPTVSAGQDTLLGLGATLELKGTAVDSFGGSIVMWEWDIGGTGNFVRTSSSDTTITLPTVPSNVTIVFRATDDDGLSSVDTVKVSAVNGLSWTTRTSGTTSALYSLAMNDSLLVAVGASGNVRTSTDGITWTQRDLGANVSMYAVVWTGSQFVATGQSGAVRTSLDGITWAGQNSGTNSTLSGLAWTGTRLVAVGPAGSILTSPDGVAWMAQPLDTAIGLSAIVWTGTQLLAMNFSGAIRMSPDGITWTNPSSSGTGGTSQALAWMGNRYVVVSGLGRFVRTSPDGVIWSQMMLGTNFTATTMNSLVWTGSQLAAVGTPGYVWLSVDGETWSQVRFGTVNILHSLIWTGTRFVAVGASGMIVTSP
jgi:hypothetical protein